jgi:hypothetical protein
MGLQIILKTSRKIVKKKKKVEELSNTLKLLDHSK